MPGQYAPNSAAVLARLRKDSKAHFAEDFGTVLYRERFAHPPVDGIKHHVEYMLANRKPNMQQPFFDAPTRQEMLNRILCRLFSRLPLYECRSEISKFAGCVLALMENENDAFRIIWLFLTRLELSDYFEDGRDDSIFLDDIQHTIDLIRLLWPSVYTSFLKYNCLSDLDALVAAFLRSILTVGYDEDYQSFACFAPLLHRLLISASPNDDPRQFFRYAVACAIGRHYAEFEMALYPTDLKHLCKLIQTKMPVNKALIKLLDAPVEPSHIRLCAACSQAPFVAAGSGLLLAPPLASLSAPLFAAGITIGMMAAGVLGLKLGSKTGLARLQDMLRELVLASDEVVQFQHKAKVDSDAEKATGQTLHDSEAQAELEEVDEEPLWWFSWHSSDQLSHDASTYSTTD